MGATHPCKGESAVKLIDTTQAVGHVLCHDMTQIIPGVTKDARFRKGHIVTEEDIPVLLSMGKEKPRKLVLIAENNAAFIGAKRHSAFDSRFRQRLTKMRRLSRLSFSALIISSVFSLID